MLQYFEVSDSKLLLILHSDIYFSLFTYRVRGKTNKWRICNVSYSPYAIFFLIDAHIVQVTKPRMNCLSIAPCHLACMFSIACMNDARNGSMAQENAGLTPPSVECSFLIAGSCPLRSLIDQQVPTSATVVAIPLLTSSALGKIHR